MYDCIQIILKTDDTISMLYIHCTYDHSTYLNIDHSQHGQTLSTCKDQVMILEPIQHGARPLPFTYYVRYETMYSHLGFMIFQCLNVKKHKI